MIDIKLTNDQAIVLFEFLARFSDKNELSILDEAEEKVLSFLEGILEKELAEPFSPEWINILRDARNRVVGSKY